MDALIDMSPRLVMRNIPYRGFGAVKNGADMFMSKPRTKMNSDAPYAIRGEFCVSIGCVIRAQFVFAVSHVIRMTKNLKILGPVVITNSIFMVYLHAIRYGVEECLKHNSVSKRVKRHSIQEKMKFLVPIFGGRHFEESLSPKSADRVSPLERLQTAKARNLVDTLKAAHRFEYFHYQSPLIDVPRERLGRRHGYRFLGATLAKPFNYSLPIIGSPQW